MEERVFGAAAVCERTEDWGMRREFSRVWLWIRMRSSASHFSRRFTYGVEILSTAGLNAKPSETALCELWRFLGLLMAICLCGGMPANSLCFWVL